jgi:uncharacterized protein with HEPN domain
MGKREYKFFINDIIQSIEIIEMYARGLTFGDFEKSLEKQDAITRRLEIIGEAVKNIPHDIRIQFPQIPWKKISGLRDVMIHNYFGVSSERIWKILSQDLPELKLKWYYFKKA